MTLHEFLQSPTGKKYSQAHWARTFGLSRAYFNQLASGVKIPSLSVALHLDERTDGMINIRKWLPPRAADKRAGADDAGHSS